MNVISAESNKLTYPNIPLVTTVDGLNYFNGKYNPVRKLVKTYNLETGSTQNEIALQNTVRTGECVLYYHRIKITRKSLTDSTAFYQFEEAGPISDSGVIIPVNPYGLVTTYDFACLSSHTTDTGTDGVYNYIYLWMCTCDKDYNIISTPCKLEITYEQYCL